MLDIWYARVGAAKPFLKWAGGKTQLLFEQPELFPHFEGRYIEPFLGGGAAFFFQMKRHNHPCRARLGDTNLALVKTFIAVRDRPEALADSLDVLQAGFDSARDKEVFYYDLRDQFNDGWDDGSAARFIFLNQTCWNGLFRVNRAGNFNVPFGSRRSGRVVPSREALESAAAALAQADIRATSWQNTVALAEPGDFVFLDPPYFSDVARGDVKYQKRMFTRRHHEELADALVSMAKRGIDFVLTNSAEPDMVDLYASRGLALELVHLPRSINSRSERRLRAAEVIVRPGTGAPLVTDLDVEVLLHEI